MLKKNRSRKAKVLAGEFEWAERQVVRRPDTYGWAKMPRYMMPYLALLRHKRVVGSMDCDRVYLELLTHDYGDGIIETRDADEHAFNCGYVGARAARSWRERMDKLVEIGAVISKKKNMREHGFVLLRDADFVVRKIEQSDDGQKDEIPELARAYWRIRKEVGGADDDALDLAVGRFARAILRKSGRKVPDLTDGIEARERIVEWNDKIADALAGLSDDDLFDASVGTKVSAADQLMTKFGEKERWAQLKTKKGVRPKDRIVEVRPKEAP